MPLADLSGVVTDWGDFIVSLGAHEYWGALTTTVKSGSCYRKELEALYPRAG